MLADLHGGAGVHATACSRVESQRSEPVVSRSELQNTSVYRDMSAMTDFAFDSENFRRMAAIQVASFRQGS